MQAGQVVCESGCRPLRSRTIVGFGQSGKPPAFGHNDPKTDDKLGCQHQLGEARGDRSECDFGIGTGVENRSKALEQPVTALQNNRLKQCRRAAPCLRIAVPTTALNHFRA